MARFEADEYTSLDEALQDIDAATSSIIEKYQLPNGAAQNQFLPPPVLLRLRLRVRVPSNPLSYLHR
jgi:hypothetical protein